MPTLISVDQLSTHHNRDYSDAQTQSAAEQVIDGLEGVLTEYLNRPLVAEEFSEQASPMESHWPSSAHEVVLRNTPVQSVIEVTMDGDVVPEGDYTVNPWGLTLRFIHLWSATINVTYTAGLVDQNLSGSRPQYAIQHVLLAAGAREMGRHLEMTHGATSMNVDGYSIGLITEFFTESELNTLRRWRRRTVS